MDVIRRCSVAGAAVLLIAHAAHAQGVAFQPVVGSLPNGPTLGVTPSVSIDRRYVRLGVNPQFIGVEGFNTFLVPAAVGGGPGGPGALGGVGLGGGAVGGEQFRAGMDGIISPMTAYGDYSSPYGYGYGFSGDPAPADFGRGGVAAAPQGGRAIARRAPTPKAPRRAKNSRVKSPAGAATSGPRTKGQP